jgi:hypothetical protein
MPPIKDMEKYIANLWDWQILDGCFGNRGISPTDLDGAVERNKHLLVLETKSPGVEVPKGQEILFKSLVETAKAKVVVVWGRRNQPERARLYDSFHPDGMDIDDVDLPRLRSYVTRWFEWADKG